MKRVGLLSLLFWAVFLSVALIIGGCAGGGGGTGTSYWGGDGGGGTAQTYSVSGTLRNAMSNQPVQGATCTLSQTKSGNFIKDFLRIARETVVTTMATTDQNGLYSLTDVPAGAYTLTISKADYITYEEKDLSVTGDTANVDRSIIQTSQWNQMAGSDHPYDASKSYVIVQTDIPSKGLRGAGNSATITPSSGVQIGYFTDATPPTIDWNATATYQNGKILFYNLTPGVQYTLSFTSPGTTFVSLSILPSTGGAIQNYSGLATTPAPNPTTTPTPTPTPSPSPTASPQPSPTQSPGGGGGGGGGGEGGGGGGPVAAKLGFKVQPTDVTAGVAITPSVEVAIQDASDNTVTTATGDITISIDTNPGDSSLSGTKKVSAVAGVATFDDLSLNKTCEGYTLKATSGTLTEATSSTFKVTARNYTAWSDKGIVYTAPANGNAYYPCVLYDTNGFEDAGKKYAMWYADGNGAVFLVTSPDGTSWSTPTTMTGLSNANHVQVLYDANRFGLGSLGPKYRIWYWTNIIYTISSMATAQSVDGVTWVNNTALTQNASAKLVTGDDNWPTYYWKRGSFGPIHLFYQPGAANSGDDPWSYSYVMYYDGTQGTPEATGLAYSADALLWKAYTENPVLSGTANAWDSTYSTFGTVYHDAIGFHFWYSGGQSSLNEGIGYAFSTEGKTNWTKNPSYIFHISDAYAVSYRNMRVCTPSIIDDGTGVLKMYYTAQATGGKKKIGRATLIP